MSYIFEPEIIQACVREGLRPDLDDSLDAITVALGERYPGLIDPGPRRWIFSNAGGAMGQIHLLYASLTEYILFFGTPVGTEGHSGRYATEVWDAVIAGDMWAYYEGDREREVFRPGDMAHLAGGRAKGYRLPDAGWMIEYSRGPIPTMLPFALADTALSTLDLQSFVRTLAAYARHVLRSWGRRGPNGAS
jgi:C-8 sterol isomerase